MFKFCPSCASEKISFNVNIFRCSDCNFSYYHNTAAATGCVISAPDKDSEKILFLVRGKEPSLGKLDLPGGFIDPGEGALEGLYRELKEELSWLPQIPKGESLYNVFKLFASFPNVYLFKGINYNTCDLYFYVNAPELEQKDLQLERAEIIEALFLRPDEIDFDKLAFESTKRAVKTYLEWKLSSV
jgi:ADP-ribose pyrophosphatase YjhB (NUDIX family)